MFSDESVKHGNGVWHAGADRREQNFLFGAKVGDEIIVKESDRVCDLPLRIVPGPPAMRQPLAQTKRQDQAMVMVVREGNQAGMTLGRHFFYTSTSSTLGARFMMNSKRGWTSLPIKV